MLQARMFLRIAPAQWGQNRLSDVRDAGFALDADGVNLSVRWLYLAYQHPGDHLGVSMGIIPLVMPVGAFHDGILRTTGAGISASYKLAEWCSPRFFWSRPYNDYPEGGTGEERLHDKMDLFGLIVPFTHSESQTELTPWTLYSLIGKNCSYWTSKVPATATRRRKADDDGRAWWMGATFRTGYFEPFLLKANAAYGSINTGSREADFNTRGWQAALSLEYRLRDCLPGIFGWYASGSDEDEVRKDRMWGYTPTLSAGDQGFEATSFGFNPSDGLNSGAVIGYSMGGTWGVGARVREVSFLPDLRHELVVACYGGTNDDSLAQNYSAHRPNMFDKTILTKSDRAIEVNFNSEYTVNSNLSFIVQLGMIDLHRGSEDWDRWNSNRQTWQALTTVKFKF
jgi:hypothetical protein